MGDIVDIVFGSITLILLFGCLIFLAIMAIKYQCIMDIKRSYYFSNLDEHDKSVVSTYQHIKVSFKELFGHEESEK